MKKLVIKYCGDCPSCRAQQNLFGEWIHVCLRTGTQITRLNMPENCPLPDDSGKPDQGGK